MATTYFIHEYLYPPDPHARVLTWVGRKRGGGTGKANIHKKHKRGRKPQATNKPLQSQSQQNQMNF